MHSDDAETDPLAGVKATRTLLNFARDDFVDFLTELRTADGMTERIKGFGEILASLKKAAQQSFEAETQLAKLGSSIHPIGNGSLDLDSAKRDVLERLARLAATQED